MVKRNSHINALGLDDRKFPWPPMCVNAWIDHVRGKPDPEWIIPGLVPYDAAILVSGAAKRAFKTWLAFLITICIALGKGILEPLQPTSALKCLVIEYEGPEKQTANRWDWLMKPFEEHVPNGYLRMMHRYPVKLDDKEQLSVLCDLVEREGIKFVVVDTLAKSHSGEENSVKEMTIVMDAIDRLRQAMGGGSVLYLHHLRKPTEKLDADIDDDIRGSTALAGFYDVHFALRKRLQNQDFLDFTVRQSDDEERNFKLRWDIDKEAGRAEVMMEEQDPDNVTTEQVEDYVAALVVGSDYTLKAFCDAWKCSKQMALGVRDKLVEDGILIKSSARGAYRVAETGE